MHTDRVLETLRAQVAIVNPDVDPNLVRPGSSLEGLGCTSIDRAEITVLTMEALRVELSPQELGDVHDVSTLVEALAGKL